MVDSFELIESNKELIIQKDKTKEVEIKIISELINQLVIPNFNRDKLSKEVLVSVSTIHWFWHSMYGKKEYEIAGVPRKFVVFEEPDNIQDYYYDYNEKPEKIGRFFGINELGQFEAGEFIKNSEKVLGWDFSLIIYPVKRYTHETTKVELKSKNYSVEDMLKQIPFFELHSLITEKLRMCNLYTDHPEVELEHEKRYYDYLKQMLRPINFTNLKG